MAEEKTKCKACGCKLDDGSRFCSHCGWKIADSVPTAAVPDIPVSPEQGKAVPSGVAYDKPSTGKRILAFMFDSLLIILPLLFYVAPQLDSFSIHVLSNQGAGLVFDETLIISFILPLFFAIAWMTMLGLLRDGLKNGQSPGKRLFGLMVLKVKDNRPCSKGRSLLRNFLVWFPLVSILGMILDPILVLFHPRGLRIGDILAGTQVIKAGDYRSAKNNMSRST